MLLITSHIRWWPYQLSCHLNISIVQIKEKNLHLAVCAVIFSVAYFEVYFRKVLLLKKLGQITVVGTGLLGGSLGAGCFAIFSKSPPAPPKKIEHCLVGAVGDCHSRLRLLRNDDSLRFVFFWEPAEDQVECSQ